MAKNDDLHLGGVARNFLEMGINQYEAHKDKVKKDK